MPPKAPRVSRSKEGGDSSVPSLPTINPVLNAAQVRFDKWVKRVQELTRARTDAIRHKSSLVLTLRDGESKVRALMSDADTTAYAPLKPPPKPVETTEEGVAAANNTSKPPKGKTTGSGKGATATEPVIEQWKAPEPAEAKRLQKAGDALMAAFYMKKGGPDKVPESDKSKKVSLFKRRVVAVDAPSSLATVVPGSPTAGAVGADQQSPLPIAAPQSAPSQQSLSVSFSPDTNAGTANKPTKAQKGSKGKAHDPDSSPTGDAPKSATLTQMVSMSLTAGSAVVLEEVPPEGLTSSTKGGRTPRGGAKDKPTSKKTVEPEKEASVDGGGVDANAPAAGTSLADDSNSFRGLDGVTSTNPLADGMDKPKHSTFGQWNKILQLRSERLVLEEENDSKRAQALQARDRVNQLKDMETIARYSLAAAQKDLEALTGSPVAPIPGITSPLLQPQPPGTPRTGGPPQSSSGASPASPESSPVRIHASATR